MKILDKENFTRLIRLPLHTERQLLPSSPRSLLGKTTGTSAFLGTNLQVKLLFLTQAKHRQTIPR